MNLSDFVRENTLETKVLSIKDTINYKFDLDGARTALKGLEDLKIKIRQLSINELQAARERLIAGDHLGYIATVCGYALMDAKSGEGISALTVQSSKPSALGLYVCACAEITQYSEGVDAHNYEEKQKELKEAMKKAHKSPNERKKA